MKTKLLLLAAVFAAVAILQADPQEDFAKQFNISNTVTITTNLLFFLSSREDSGGPAALLAKSDQSLRSGIAPNPFYTPSTNHMLVQFLVFPFNQTLDFHLFDDKGNEVQKTKQGLANSNPVHLPTTMSEYDKLRRLFVKQNEKMVAYPLFRPDDMFVITNKGVYTMEVRMRICVQVTNGVPDYQVMQNIKQFPDGPFGIVVSKPLRVKVIKE